MRWSGQHPLLSKPDGHQRLASVASAIALALIALIGFGVGCLAPKRLLLDVHRTLPKDPDHGIPVRIIRVSDRRVFRELHRHEKRASADPGTWASRENHPFVPQLETGGIDDRKITVRAVAQMRNPKTGKVYNDLLLPEGRSVEILSREAITEAFRKSGYRVLERGEMGYQSAYPVEADVEEFWAWNVLGKARFKHYTDRSQSVHVLHFEVALRITAPFQPFERGRRVEGKVALHSMLWTSRKSFKNAIFKGLDDLVDNLREELTLARIGSSRTFVPVPGPAPTRSPGGVAAL
jgi:hypothetical protein